MTPAEQLAETIRLEGARVLATLIRTLGSLQLAEDAVQDAAVAALRTWPRDGIPGFAAGAGTGRDRPGTPVPGRLLAEMSPD